VILFRVKKYLTYRKRAVNQFGLHSPFLFELYNTCFKPKFTHPFPEIQAARDDLKRNQELIQVSDFGAGSLVTKSISRKVKEMYKSASISKKQGELLNRLVKFLEPKMVLELGTHLGVSGDLISGTFKSQLPIVIDGIDSVDLVYVDGNHDFENTIWHFETLLKKINENSVIIFDDINWTEDMALAWEQIKQHKDVSISINCYKFGMVFFRKGIEKQDFYFKL